MTAPRADAAGQGRKRKAREVWLHWYGKRDQTVCAHPKTCSQEKFLFREVLPRSKRRGAK